MQVLAAICPPPDTYSQKLRSVLDPVAPSPRLLLSTSRKYQRCMIQEAAVYPIACHSRVSYDVHLCSILTELSIDSSCGPQHVCNKQLKEDT
eukprot:6484514-Amphidinium_carterae.1